MSKVRKADAPVATIQHKDAGNGIAISKAGAAGDAQAGPPRKSASWRDFEGIDPLYALMGEVQERPVIESDGTLQEETLSHYLDVLLVQKAAKKPKDWIEVWARMQIPSEHQAEVLTFILSFGRDHKAAIDGQSLGVVIAELIKAHKVKTKAVEDALIATFRDRRDKIKVFQDLFFAIFPKGPESEWGWSRVGWSWAEWWKMLEKTMDTVHTLNAFNQLIALLNRIEAAGSKPLAQQLLWTEVRLQSVRAFMCEKGNVEDEDLDVCLDATLRK